MRTVAVGRVIDMKIPATFGIWTPISPSESLVPIQAVMRLRNIEQFKEHAFSFHNILGDDGKRFKVFPDLNAFLLFLRNQDHASKSFEYEYPAESWLQYILYSSQ
jgi:hypothetical protein